MPLRSLNTHARHSDKLRTGTASMRLPKINDSASAMEHGLLAISCSALDKDEEVSSADDCVGPAHRPSVEECLLRIEFVHCR